MDEAVSLSGMQLPKLYSTRQEPDPIVWGRFCSPASNWRWYILEGEQGETSVIFYGWMSHNLEPGGRFIRTDLPSMAAYFGITIARDTAFVACRFSVVQQHEQAILGQQDARNRRGRHRVG